MSTRAERERVLQGQDPIVNTIVGHLTMKGWSGDRILKNVAGKVYSPNRALVRVEYDSVNLHYWVAGEYTSQGENVLSGCFACIKAAASPQEIAVAMDAFLIDAETRISRSFAVHFLGNKPQGTSVGRM